jgi:hypothetical protein
MTDSFNEISIRGRLAYGVSCLENALLHFNIQNDLLEKEVLPRIWSFASSSDLTAWDDSVKEIDPVCILDNNSPGSRLQKLYRSLPTIIIEMISDVIEIGAGNLYGGTTGYSPFSMKPLLRVIKTCKMNHISLPQLEPFKRSSFEEMHGWGFEREKSFFTF